MWQQSNLLTCVFLLSLVTLGSANAAANVHHPDRPNIVFFLVDDLGWQDTSVAMWNKPTLFQKHFRTPNVQRLAEQGIRFSHAYSCAVCSPTRTSIMTGQNAARHQVTNWTFDAEHETSGRTNRLLPPAQWKRQGLQPDQVTLPMLLKTVGYRTIHCGKAHWGALRTKGSDPTHLGFDINIAGHHAGAPGSYQGSDDYGNRSEDPGRKRWAVPGLEKYHGTETHLTDALALEACSAIQSAVDRAQPFFLYMAPYAVHTPIQQHPRFIENYLGKNYPGTDIAIPKAEARYASMVEGFDDALGRILDQLELSGVADNTLIIFTSDNGGLSVHGRGTTPMNTGANTHCWPLREGKGSAYEGGIRVPLIVSWAQPVENERQRWLPIRPFSQSTVPVICEDYFPTICHWAGVDLQQSFRQLAENSSGPKTNLARPVVDGIDITPAITGSQENRMRPLFFTTRMSGVLQVRGINPIRR